MTRSLAARIVPLFIASTLGAQQTVPSDLGTRIDHIFDRFTRTTPGCGVGLAKDGRTLYTHGYGSSNLEYDVPNTENTVFESGSVAKQFTASAMLMLVADGKLTLDDDIHKYLPEVPSFGGQRITIRNLLTHTSGLRDQWGLLGIEGRGPGTQVHSPLTTLDLVVHQKMLNFPPGSDYLYSNTGYALAALIIERVSGKTLQEFTQERLFKPLGMTHTQLRDDFTRVVPNRATAYSGAEATGFHQDMPFTNMIGNGGVLSTMGDLLKWNENLDHPTVGGPKYVEAIETQMRLTNGRLLTYALGLEVVDYQGIREIGHSGSTAGYRTFLGALSRPARVGGRLVQRGVRESHVAAPSGGRSRSGQAVGCRTATGRLGERDAVAGRGAVEMGGDVSGSAHGSNDHAVGRQRVAIDRRTWRRDLDAAGGGSFSGAAGRRHVERRRRRTCAAADSCGWGYGSLRGGSSRGFAEDRGLRRDVHERRAGCRAHACGEGREARDAAAAGGRVRATAGLYG